MTPRTQPAAMTTALHPQNLTSIWQTGEYAVSRQGDVLAPAENTYSLNISRLPATDRSCIWTFLEFMHEYSGTAWRLVPGADADIWFVDGRQPAAAAQPAATVTLPHATVRVLNTAPPAAQMEDNMLVRPLQIEAFAAVLLRMEAQLKAVPRPATSA